jgi:hypothetical protein
MLRQDLERLSREELIAEAERLSISRPRVLTQPELVDEIIGRTAKSERERTKARGWLGRARDLLARVVERGLHLPEAARVIRRESEDKGWPPPPPPLPTVTLAEIYAAQGHVDRALAVLDEVIAREPDHREARAMRARFAEPSHRSRARAAKDRDAPVAIEPPPVGDEHARVEEARASGACEPASQSNLHTPTPTPNPPSEAPAVAEVSVAASASSLAQAPRAHVLEEPPLPDRYEVDEVVAIAVDPRTIYLYWEVRPTTLARTRARQPDGYLCVRVATVTASWEGPMVDTRDLPVDALYGDRFLREIQPGANVRVSIGWRSEEDFAPFAVGAEVTAPRAVPVETVAKEVARWEAEPLIAPFTQGAPPPDPRPWLAPTRRIEPVAPSAFATAGPYGMGRPEGGPADTGVAIWGAGPDGASAAGSDAYELSEEGEDVFEALAGWFEPGGSSELGRSGPMRRPRRVKLLRRVRVAWPGAPGPGERAARELALGGGSELALGGGSELVRGGGSELSR